MAAVVAGLLAGGLAVPSSALAGPEDEKRRVDASIEQLKGHLHDTSEDLSSAYAALQQTRSQLPAAQARLAKAERAEAAAHERDVELGRRLAVSKQAEAKAVAAIAAAEHDADAVSSVLGSIARQAYRSSGMGELSVALQAQSATTSPPGCPGRHRDADPGRCPRPACRRPGRQCSRPRTSGRGAPAERAAQGASGGRAGRGAAGG
jgi:hypothetical protein